MTILNEDRGCACGLARTTWPLCSSRFAKSDHDDRCRNPVTLDSGNTSRCGHDKECHKTSRQAKATTEEIRRAARDNPELPRQFVADLLQATEEMSAGMTTPYERKSRA